MSFRHRGMLRGYHGSLRLAGYHRLAFPDIYVHVSLRNTRGGCCPSIEAILLDNARVIPESEEDWLLDGKRKLHSFLKTRVVGRRLKGRLEKDSGADPGEHGGGAYEESPVIHR